jgi:hypothetical protein
MVPVETGLGEGTVSVRLEETRVFVPLGARPGEFDIGLTRTPGTMHRDLLDTLVHDSAVNLEEEREAWNYGEFLLVDTTQAPISSEPTSTSQGRVVGQLRVREGLPLLLDVFDEFWLTPEPVDAPHHQEGSEWILTFEVEPSFRGSIGELRIHAPTRSIVIPSGPDPDPLDRRLALVPGTLDRVTRDKAVAEARRQADALETMHVVALASQLSTELVRADGSCAAFEETSETWALMFEGYTLTIVPENGQCLVTVEPTTLQHSRRFRDIVGPGGRVERGADAQPEKR